MALTTQSQLQGLLPGQPLTLYCAAPANTAQSNTWWSQWLNTRYPYSTAGAAPGSTGGVSPTSSTTGALPYSNGGALATSVGKAMVSLHAGVVGTIWLIDRLFHSDGLSGTVTTLQAVQAAAAPIWTRGDLTGVGVMGALEIYTSLGATGATATVLYTNQAGVSGQSTTVALPANTNQMKAGALYLIPLVSGDTGIQSVQSVQLSGSTGTAGNFGVTLFRPLLLLPCPAPSGQWLNDWMDTGLPVIDDNACLSFLTLGNGSVAPFGMELDLVQA